VGVREGAGVRRARAEDPDHAGGGGGERADAPAKALKQVDCPVSSQRKVQLDSIAAVLKAPPPTNNAIRSATMFHGPTALFSLAAAFALPVCAHAQAAKTITPKPRHETQAQLQKEATISLASATATAQAAVPGGKIAGHELEREKGKLIYSFEIKTAGKSGIDEVNIDAVTGTLIEKVHESPSDEAKEKAADRKPPVRKP
jgi:hypothetical protein